MGQKVNPHGLRVGVIKDWDSRWYAKNELVGDLLVEDHKIREYLKKTLYSAGVPKIEIERDNAKVRIYLHCAKPGVVIGKGGTEIERIRLQVEKMIGKSVALNIVEVKSMDTDAQLVAENIAQQLEGRVAHRRAMKNAMGRAMRAGALGIKVTCSGRLGGREIAGVEHYHDGTIPLQTLRTTPRTLDAKNFKERPDRPRRERRDGDRRDDRRGGGRRDDRRQSGPTYNRIQSRPAPKPVEAAETAPAAEAEAPEIQEGGQG